MAVSTSGTAGPGGDTELKSVGHGVLRHRCCGPTYSDANHAPSR
ncbi:MULTISPECIES: hypothetical protein [unclassified Rhodococcus (in: high G+C Gram-positive bacteria)]|nr:MULTISPECIES: hypothetical protein [unclassified Rhodococcus (in: high G+C Gram-positive bacteria)]